ncbi:MAG: glycosyltransferase [Bacteroidota bacterium]|nr:glycosyltransferase [Bacteroidota bacterium]MDP3144648.1 glycosyltransferase [Bacteroidota bacterium]
MHSFLIILFFVSVVLILQTYLFYPLWMILFTVKDKKEDVLYSIDDNLPTVGLLIAAYNEEKIIKEKLLSVFKTNYPLSKIKVYVGSDASTDKTDDIISKLCLQYPNLNLIKFGGRSGKANIINALAENVNEDIFILTDANVIFKEDTIFNLVRHFKDEKFAQVCANIIKVSGSDLGIAKQEKSYIVFENKIKFAEYQRWNIVMGAEGGCYAIRKEFYRPVPTNFFMDDFFMTMNVIEQGKSIVFDKNAICYEDVPTQADEEFKRKVRISIGNFQNLFRYKKLLFPFWNKIAFAFWSHKVLRWLTPFFLLICLCCSIILLFSSQLFLVLFCVQFFLMLMPIINLVLPFKLSIFKFISHFYLMNLALLKGFLIFVKGVETSIWQPTKRNIE